MALIYIVEDDVNIREIESFALKNSGYTIEDFACAKDFFARIRDKVPDLVLLDIMLPDEDGLEIVKKLRKKAETRMVPIIMVTAKTSEMDKVKGLDIGADDYLTKPFNILELKARIRALLRRSASGKKKAAVENRLVCGHILLDCDARNAYNDGALVDLTAKEFDLMELLMRNPNRVYSRETLLDAIWGYDVSSEIRTVDVHIRRLREKLEKNPAQPEHILTKWGVGYYFKY